MKKPDVCHSPKHEETFLFCYNCKKKHIILNKKRQKEMTTSPSPYIDPVLLTLPMATILNTRNKKETKYICTCGQVYHHEDINIVTSGHSFSHSVIKKKEDVLQIKIHCYEVTFFSSWIQKRSYYYLISFNFKKGRTFLFSPRYSYSGKIPKWYERGPICNISYCIPSNALKVFIPQETLQILSHELQKCHEIELGFPVKSVLDYKIDFNESNKRGKSQRLELQNLTHYNRFPAINSFVISGLVSNAYHEQYSKTYCSRQNTLRKLRKVNSNSPRQFMDIIDAFSIPNTSSIRKNLSNDLCYVPMAFAFLKLSKDINLLVLFLNSFSQWRISVEDIFNLFYIYKKHNYSLKKVISKFNANPQLISDTNYMLTEVRQFIPDYLLDCKLSIKELHDNLMKDYRKIQKTNFELTYSPEELFFEEVLGGYSFQLAKETAELAKVASYMHICVDSYWKRAYLKECYIIVVYKKDVPHVCIELRRDTEGIKVVQAKIKGNHLSKGKDRETIFKWIENKKLVVSTYDLKSSDDDDE